MGEPVKGTVTSLSSLFAPEDAQKASVRVQEAIAERHKELDQLQAFLNDNTTLVNHVKKLPDQLHHDIMVPFGKAAFFPGRLIHTNEFLVLLGEGYFAERTSKQTIEILKRRGNELGSQIETLKAVIKDLKFEASFFDETATEAAEGIVEIREDFVDEASNDDKAITGEEEYTRILSRMEELEKEELESEITEECEDDADLSHLISSEPRDSLDLPVSKESDISSSHAKVPTSNVSNAPSSLIEHDKSKEGSKNEISNFGSSTGNDRSMAFTGSIVEHTHNIEKSHKGQTPVPASKPVSRFKQQRK